MLNRREFFLRAEKIAWQASAGMKLPAIMLDIDNFKRVNDTHGHHAGEYPRDGPPHRRNGAISLLLLIGL